MLILTFLFTAAPRFTNFTVDFRGAQIFFKILVAAVLVSSCQPSTNASHNTVSEPDSANEKASKVKTGTEQNEPPWFCQPEGAKKRHSMDRYQTRSPKGRRRPL